MKRKISITIAGLTIGAIAAVWALNSDQIFPPEITDLPELVAIDAGPFDFRMSGKYKIGTQTVDAPMQHFENAPAFYVMKYQVSQSEYVRCVNDGACNATNTKKGENLPQANISFYDAKAYAKWFSAKTGKHWRLPTSLEWQRYAGDGYIDLAFGDLNDKKDPAKRWLAQYAQQVALRGESDLNLRARGANGENNLGVADISANVWEWTQTCFYNTQLETDGQTIVKAHENCAVRAAEGKHPAFIIEFVRDANVGGCAAGIPPDFLGFRLILEDKPS